MEWKARNRSGRPRLRAIPRVRTTGAPLSAAVGLALSFAACSGSGDGPTNPLPPGPDADPVVLKGFGLSPRGFPVSYDLLLDFFEEVDAFPDGAAFWNGSWRDDILDGADAGTIPEAATVLATRGSPDNLYVFGWRNDDGPTIRVPSDLRNDWTNETAIALYQSMLEDFVTIHQPKYVFLGNESDFYFESDPVDYARWIGVYEATYDRIKAASPDTRVGPVFNFEHMAGSGVLNGWTDPHWGALESHDLAKVDLIAVTVYPWFNHATAAAVPSSYLDPLVQRIGSTPIAITETGWPAENLGGLSPLWTASPQEQVTYAGRVEAMIAGRDVEILNWLFLHAMVDPGGSPLSWQLFGSLSLRDEEGAKRPVYDVWAALRP